MIKPGFFHYILCLFFLTLGCQTFIFSQASLSLDASESEVKNVIQFFISPEEFITLKKARGQKIECERAKVKTDDGKKLVEKLKIRGQSSLSFDRKSFNVNLFFPHTFSWGEEEKELKEFYLISLSMDQNYYRCALSYRLLHELGLFSPFIAFTEVKINRESQGVYLVVEKPHENKMKTGNSPFVLRRGYQHQVADQKYDKKKAKWKKKDYLETYDQMYQLLQNYEGKNLYQELNKRLDLESYFSWLAFNFFMMNGDYADELYLYALPDHQEIRFGILPWDYDDILTGSPHHKKDYGFHKGWNDTYMLIAEEEMDRAICMDEYLHQQYIRSLKELLLSLSPEVIKRVFEEVYTELDPFYQKSEIIEMSQYDLKGTTNHEKFENDFRAAYRYLVSRHTWLTVAL